MILNAQLIAQNNDHLVKFAISTKTMCNFIDSIKFQSVSLCFNGKYSPSLTVLPHIFSKNKSPI